MKRILTVLPLLVLFGCDTVPVKELANRGADLNDDALEAAEFTVCYGASVGSIRRKYGSSELAKIWREFCNQTDSLDIQK